MFIKHPVPRALAVSRQCHRLSSHLLSNHTICCRRTYAAATTSKVSSSSTPFTVSDIAGVRVAYRDDGGPTTGLSVVMRAGARYSAIPGLPHLLEKFAWKNTQKRTAFRVTRETELLGGLLTSATSRETVSVSAQCLREDIPYFLEALADVAILTKYTDYEYHGDVLPLAQLDYDALQTSSVAVALNALHATAFHHGLGADVLTSPTVPVKVELIKSFAQTAYSKANLVLVASGANADELTPQLQEFWKDLPAGELLPTPKAKFSSGETRISHRSSSNVIAIAFPGSSLYSQASPELVVLSHLLGGLPKVKWSNGQSALAKIASSVGGGAELVSSNIAYSDAGLFTILALGPSYSVGEATSQALKLLRDIAKGSVTIKPDELKRAIASARYTTYASGEPRLSSLEPIGQAVLDTGNAPDYDSVVAEYNKVTAEKIQKAAAKMLETTPSVAAVGQTHLLPFYDEL